MRVPFKRKRSLFFILLKHPMIVNIMRRDYSYSAIQSVQQSRY